MIYDRVSCSSASVGQMGPAAGAGHPPGGSGAGADPAAGTEPWPGRRAAGSVSSSVTSVTASIGDTWPRLPSPGLLG